MRLLESRAGSTISLESDRSSLRNTLQSVPEPTAVAGRFMQDDCDNAEDITCSSLSVDYSSMLDFDLEPIDLSMWWVRKAVDQ
jgi:hypothetical protein